MEVMKEKYWNAFIQSGWIQDPKTQKEKFTQIFEEYAKKGLKDVKEVGENLADPNKVHNPAGRILEVTTMPFRFVLQLISA